jgi:hypothetical protein
MVSLLAVDSSESWTMMTTWLLCQLLQELVLHTADFSADQDVVAIAHDQTKQV